MVDESESLPLIGELPTGWTVSRFGDVLEGGTRNGIYKSKEFHGSGTKIVNMGELFAHPRLRDVPMKRVQLSVVEIQKSTLNSGDLLFARRSLVAEGAGKCIIVCDVSEPTTFESSIIRARPNPKAADSLFLYYLFNSPYGVHALRTIRRQVAVSGITGADLVELPIPLPPLAAQRAIAAVLGALDDKIELNRRMNATLEAMARALFQSWFVDFDPVRAKLDGRQPPGLDAATAALFPDRFQDSPLGPIPRGWRIERLGDHVELQRGKTYKSKLKDLPGPYLLGLASIGRNGGFRADKLLTYGGDCPDNLLVYPGDLFVSLKDVTQSADLLGSVARMPFHFKVGRLTQDTVKLKFKDGAPSRNIVYRTLLTPEYRAHCRSHATGTTNLGLARDDFLSYPLIVPPSEIEAAFDQFIDVIDRKIGTNERQSRTLAALRDTLLPKLLSGEVRVSTAIEATA
jgi:type I restriction enzyme S subunit